MTPRSARTPWKAQHEAQNIWKPIELSERHYLTLAPNSCASCYGLGRRPGRNGNDSICNCVLRGIFRRCLARYRQVSGSNEFPPMDIRRGLPNYEFAADFVLVSERTLLGMTRYEFNLRDKPEPLAWRIFKMHVLQAADWRYCCAKLGVNRGEFFHEVYRVEQRLGRAYAEIAPIPLYPFGRYFGSTPEKRASRDAAGSAGRSRERKALGKVFSAEAPPLVMRACA